MIKPVRPTLFVGLMSGTSQDAVDAVLAEFPINGEGPPRLIASDSAPLPPQLRARLDALQEPGGGDLDNALQLHHELGLRFADSALSLLASAHAEPSSVRAIGSHGQTVRHRPAGPTPHSLQLGDAALIAARTGITTVADFRSGDIAAGGQGAPLAPLFHQAAFGNSSCQRAILNLGGMANVSFLGTGNAGPAGWDTGPGNVLLDAWAARHLGQPYDADGAFAASGRIHNGLLAALLDHPFVSRQPPKSTGREDFNAQWLERFLDRFSAIEPADVQATLAEFTAACIATAFVNRTDTEELLICGGGTRNRDLLKRIGRHLPGLAVDTTAKAGVDPQWVEALAFAWLARQRMAERSLNTQRVTGARQPVILGCVYLP